jgi:hypothetical protein
MNSANRIKNVTMHEMIWFSVRELANIPIATKSNPVIAINNSPPPILNGDANASSRTIGSDLAPTATNMDKEHSHRNINVPYTAKNFANTTSVYVTGTENKF